MENRGFFVGRADVVGGLGVMQNEKCKMQNAKCKMGVAGFGLRGAESWAGFIRCRNPAPTLEYQHGAPAGPPPLPGRQVSWG